eukprot:6458788-Pyramimonas_sp.AAC.1
MSGCLVESGSTRGDALINQLSCCCLQLVLSLHAVSSLSQSEVGSQRSSQPSPPIGLLIAVMRAPGARRSSR